MAPVRKPEKPVSRYEKYRTTRKSESRNHSSCTLPLGSMILENVKPRCTLKCEKYKVHKSTPRRTSSALGRSTTRMGVIVNHYRVIDMSMTREIPPLQPALSLMELDSSPHTEEEKLAKPQKLKNSRRFFNSTSEELVKGMESLQLTVPAPVDDSMPDLQPSHQLPNNSDTASLDTMSDVQPAYPQGWTFQYHIIFDFQPSDQPLNDHDTLDLDTMSDIQPPCPLGRMYPQHLNDDDIPLLALDK